MSELDDLWEKLAPIQAEITERYAAIRPLTKQASALEDQIRDILRGRGELFYAHYWRYRAQFTEECDTLEEARGFLAAGLDVGDLSPTGIVGPGITLDDDWEQA